MSDNVGKRRSVNKGKGGGIYVTVIAVCAVVIVTLLATVVYLTAGRKDSGDSAREETQEKRNVVVNEENVEEVVTSLSADEKVSAGYYEVTMNTTWNFENGASASDNAYVKNVATNTNDVYFDVTIAETDELVYSSPVIPLGSYLENISLDRELEQGTYDCVCTYHLIDEDQNTLSTLSISLTIVVAG